MTNLCCRSCSSFVHLWTDIVIHEGEWAFVHSLWFQIWGNSFQAPGLLKFTSSKTAAVSESRSPEDLRSPSSVPSSPVPALPLQPKPKIYNRSASEFNQPPPNVGVRYCVICSRRVEREVNIFWAYYGKLFPIVLDIEESVLRGYNISLNLVLFWG